MKTLPQEIKSEIKTRLEARKAEKTDVAQEVSRCTIWAIGAAPVLVGFWAAACFAGALLMSDGFLLLMQNWLIAVTGNM